MVDLPEFVIMLHGIGQPPSRIPAGEVRYWMTSSDFEGFAASLADQAAAAGVTPLVTIDDGNLSDLTAAAPLMRHYGIGGAFFPCVGRIGMDGYLDADDILALAGEGFEIGSHGFDHVAWTSLTGGALKREVQGSKNRLSDILGRPVYSAAMPFGAYNRRVLKAVRDAGYRVAYSSDPGISSTGSWLRRRWGYTSGERFDIGEMARMSVSVPRRAIWTAKTLLKSLR